MKTNTQREPTEQYFKGTKLYLMTNKMTCKFTELYSFKKDLNIFQQTYLLQNSTQLGQYFHPK